MGKGEYESKGFSEGIWQIENDLEKDITDMMRAAINSIFKMHPRMHFRAIVHCITIDRQSHRLRRDSNPIRVI